MTPEPEWTKIIRALCDMAEQLAQHNDATVDRGHTDKKRPCKPCLEAEHALDKLACEGFANVPTARRHADLLEALGDLLEETVGLTLDYVKERLAQAVAKKVKYESDSYEQGVADVLRHVRIFLEDNEAAPNIAKARAALEGSRHD